MLKVSFPRCAIMVFTQPPKKPYSKYDLRKIPLNIFEEAYILIFSIKNIREKNIKIIILINKYLKI